MVNIPIGVGAFKRAFAQLPEVRLINRFAEAEPANQVEGHSLLSRPGTTLYKAFGFGQVRALFTQEGAFADDLFAVVGDALFRVSAADDSVIGISGVISLDGNPEMTVVTGPGFEHLFIADGQQLQVYSGISAAKGTLTASGAVADGDEVSIDSVHYRWTTGSVDAGTPEGTSLNPWFVALGSDNAEALDNLKRAINAEGVAGVNYSTALTNAHTTVRAVMADDTKVDVEARTAGADGNIIPTAVETGANIAWGAATLEGGGAHALNGVPVPDDQGVVSIATSGSFVIVVIAQGQRFFWIRPGEITIAPLDFASAESLPDEIISVRAVGDQVWFFGTRSTEAWYVTGGTPALLRSQGQAFSRGVIEGTPVRVDDVVIVVGDDGVVRSVGGAVTRVSNHGIEEQIRKALKAERDNG